VRVRCGREEVEVKTEEGQKGSWDSGSGKAQGEREGD